MSIAQYIEGIPDAHVSQLDRFVGLLMAKNEDVNLTSIRDLHDVMIKHMVDSLEALNAIDFKPGMRVLDVGTGGGLPGIPLAIVLPDVQFTLLDSVGKKIRAVSEFIDTLGLSNVATITGRSEALAHDPDYREQFDLVLTRAVAPLRILLELAYPFVHLNGRLVCYKGPDTMTELTAAQTAMVTLRVEKPRIHTYDLPEGMGKRVLLIFAKKFETSKAYPRRTGMPTKCPL